MLYANIILPVPLETQFSYIVPESLSEKIAVGMRVLVPFGKTKTYIGIVSLFPAPAPNEITDKKGDKISFKEILSIFEPTPAVLPTQLELWQWIGSYYMAPIGDVYKAAFPLGLKTEDKYKPRVELYITLTDYYKDNNALSELLHNFGRAKKQEVVLLKYLQLAEVDKVKHLSANTLLKEVTREELLNESHCNISIIHALVERKVLCTYEKEVGRLQSGLATHYEKIKTLNEAQSNAYNNILLQMMTHRVTLLHGVTSSGKTEIYIHLIQKAIEEHKQVLYLVPEIALTVQMTSRLQTVFGNRLGIYHSKYSDAERVEIWKKQLSNSPYSVILGVRSAIFLPFQQLGLVIVDEEHEQSFKQQDPSPRYHARSAAIILASIHKAKVLLGTATPSIETYYNAQKGKFGFVELSRRYKDIQLPKVEIVNIKDLRRRKMLCGPFSPRLLRVVQDSLERGEQVILFQNRRGFAPMLECRECGWIPKCPNCDVSLTLHKKMNILTCHYCGYANKIPVECPCCHAKDIRSRGYGTEKVEDEISKILPKAKIARMDLDTTRTHNAYDRIITDFSLGKTNLLIGTQMVTKGLDFDNVSVVGILDADSMLNYPDFRAYEEAFMMMCQVSGRAGRRGKQGLVILQTGSEDLSVIQQVVHNDYKSFYRDVLEERRAFHYPPFYRLIYVYLKHREESIVETAGYELGARLREIFGDRVLGPDKPTVSRIKTLSIRKIVLKLENGIDFIRVKQALREVQTSMLHDKRYGALIIYYDVDPQ